MITNFSNQSTNITFSKIGGNATTNCSVCCPQIISNGPLCTGDTLKLNAAASEIMCAVYNWTGPNGFASTEQNPIIPSVTTANAGVYTLTITSGGATTATEITNVLIGAPSDTTFINDSICSNFLPYRKYNFNVSTAGTHYQYRKNNPPLNNPNIPHCDSIVVLNLVVNPASNYEYYDTICSGDSILFVDGKYYKTTGVYTATISNSYDCDSTVRLRLFVKPTLIIEKSASICQGEVYILNGVNYTDAGIYTQTFGCDSVIVLNLTITSGIDDILADQISIYPNPAKDELRIDVTGFGNVLRMVEITDLAGRRVETDNYPSLKQGTATINVSNLLQGIYLVKVYTDKGVITKKLVKN